MHTEDAGRVPAAAAAQAGKQQDHMRTMRAAPVWCHLCGNEDNPQEKEGDGMNGWFWMVLIAIPVAAMLPEWDKAGLR